MRLREWNSTARSPTPYAEYVFDKDIWSITKKSEQPQSQSQKDERNNLKNRIGAKVKQVCSDLFLPVGYPNTVSNGYLKYQVYDSIQGLCSYLRGVVSTSAVLMAAGVGDAEATAMSAAMTWAIRDGLGMIGGLLFSYAASPHFDAHVKEFRLLADVLNDIGLTLDMALPLLMSYELPWLGSPYLVLTSCSTLCKVACGICAGATKGNITDHFAISGNRADVNAKESTQETLVSLLGMALGVWLSKLLQSLEKFNKLQNTESCDVDERGPQDQTCQRLNQILTTEKITWVIFLVLTFIHVWANYIGVQALSLRTLNYERTRMALRHVIEECGRYAINNDQSKEDDKRDDLAEIVQRCTQKLPSPEFVSESLWTSILGMFGDRELHLGVRVKDFLRKEWSEAQWVFLQKEFETEMYMIAAHRDTSCKPSISVMMNLNAADHDQLKALVHAHVLAWCVNQYACNTKIETLLMQKLVVRSHEIVSQLFEDKTHLINSLATNGWDITRLYLGFSTWKCEWDIIHDHKE